MLSACLSKTVRRLTKLSVAIGRGFEPNPDYTHNAGTAFWLVGWTRITQLVTDYDM